MEFLQRRHEKEGTISKTKKEESREAGVSMRHHETLDSKPIPPGVHIRHAQKECTDDYDYDYDYDYSYSYYYYYYYYYYSCYYYYYYYYYYSCYYYYYYYYYY